NRDGFRDLAYIEDGERMLKITVLILLQCGVKESKPSKTYTSLEFGHFCGSFSIASELTSRSSHFALDQLTHATGEPWVTIYLNQQRPKFTNQPSPIANLEF